MQRKLEDPNTGELIWQHLVPVSPGLATVLTTMVRYHFKDRYQSAKKRSKQQVFTGTSLQYPKTQQDTTVESSNSSYTAATNSDIWTEQRLNFPVNHQSPQ